MVHKDRSFKSRLQSFVFAGRGVRLVLFHEPNAMIHAVVAVAVVALGFYLKLSRTDFSLAIIAIAMVFVAETFNTAVERLTDLVSPETHPLAAQAKDLAAGSVLIASIAAAVIGGLIFLPKIVP